MNKKVPRSIVYLAGICFFWASPLAWASEELPGKRDSLLSEYQSNFATGKEISLRSRSDQLEFLGFQFKEMKIDAKPTGKPQPQKSALAIRKEDLVGPRETFPVSVKPYYPEGAMTVRVKQGKTAEGGLSLTITAFPDSGSWGSVAVEGRKFSEKYKEGKTFVKFEATAVKGMKEVQVNVRASDFTSVGQVQAFRIFEVSEETRTITIDLDELKDENGFDPEKLSQIAFEVISMDYSLSENAQGSQIVIDNLRLVDEAQHKKEEQAAKKAKKR